MINLTQRDLKLSRSHDINPLVKVDIYTSDNKYIDTIKGGLIDGNLSIAADSDIRRTTAFNFVPGKKFDTKIAEGKYIWLDKFIRLYIGFYDEHLKEEIWYPQGKYVFTDASISYDATTNQLSVNASDMASTLNGTINGELGQQIIQYPAYVENETTGQVIKYNLIRDAVITTLTQLGGLKLNDLEIDDIGEYKAMPIKNKDWQSYRNETPLWNAIPYDLEFSSGTTVLGIIQEFVELYPNYEAYFDENAKFHINMIPDCKDDETLFKNGFLNKILINENTNIDFTPVRNVVEVWGKAIDDVDFFTEKGVSYSGNVYSMSISGYDQYYNGDLIGIKIPSTNSASASININGYGKLVIYDENTEQPLVAKRMEAGKVYVFKIKKKRQDGNDVIKAYLLGQWQPHAICVLTDGTIGEDYTLQSGKVVKKYSKSYFKEIYNCETVGFTIIPNSPFTVQKLGERLKPYSGGEFENITSDSLALARAEWELYKLTRLTDNITINIKYMPYMDVNVKVQYQSINEDKPQDYICKSVTHDFANGTTSLTLIRFYSTYFQDDYPSLVE